MADIIAGTVTKVIDGDTFEMKIVYEDKSNKYKYNENEIIRLEGTNAPELNTPAGKIAKTNLTNKLFGASVKCVVKSRDTFGRIVADVTIINS